LGTIYEGEVPTFYKSILLYKKKYEFTSLAEMQGFSTKGYYLEIGKGDEISFG